MDIKESGASLATLLTIAKAKCHALEHVLEELLVFFYKDMLQRSEFERFLLESALSPHRFMFMGRK
ncbi:MAG: hypothetical protein WBV25_10885 [Methylocella sp.]